jgi:cardiolipin synthase
VATPPPEPETSSPAAGPRGWRGFRARCLAWLDRSRFARRRAGEGAALDPEARAERRRRRRRRAALLLGAHLLGLATSVHALMTVRTSQGTIAWIVSLNTFPVVAVPAYWVFGRSRFQGYVVERRARDRENDPEARRVVELLAPLVPDPARSPGAAFAVQRLAHFPYLSGNEVELLVDGEATFRSLFDGIERAREYVLVQFYIVRDDRVGRELADRLIARARAGVSVRFLYDEIGSGDVRGDYRRRLEEAGVEVAPFGTTRGRGNRFQLNFRNHRKIVVVDGVEAWIGGHNVGDEYLGRDPEIGPWRDTHVRIAGPAVLGLQVSFLEDWSWATGESISSRLAWRAEPRGPSAVLVMPSGPADRLETASLMYQQAIQAARRRLWIASPYFVPDDAVVSALHLAALRGVDVRLLVPDRSDNAIVDAAAWGFFPSLMESGVAIHRYRGGFLHSKHLVIDDRVAAVGTANLDNRSLRLNFEVTAVVEDAAFAAAVAAMFERDLESSRRMALEEVEARPFARRLLTRGALLFSPIL